MIARLPRSIFYRSFP